MFHRFGLKLTVGLGPTKTLAKLATSLGKQRKEGVSDLVSDPFARTHLFRSLPIETVWGIGARSASKLHARGVFSVA